MEVWSPPCTPSSACCRVPVQRLAKETIIHINTRRLCSLLVPARPLAPSRLLPMEEYTSPTDAAIERLGERQETVHAELLEKMGKMEQVLARLDERPQLLPTFVTSTTFPAVMAGFTDYIGLAMVTPALPFFLFSYFTEDTESLYHNQFCGNPTTLHATPCTASDALSTQCCWSISDNANPGTGTIIPVAAENEIHATISRWTGRITAIQFIFICFANMFWAICGDRVPSMYSLMVTMLGDTACFAGAGFLRRPWEILVIRGATGVSSPLVPAIVYLLDRARSMEQVIEGVANFTLSVVLAYACASIIVAFTYVDIGWKGINIIAAGLNALSLFVVTFYSAAPTRPGPKARPEGAMKAVCTKWFMLHATTGFVQGWQMASMVMMYVLVMKNIFKFNTHQVGAVMFALPCVLLIQNRVCKMATLKYGLNAVTTFGCFLAVANLAVYTIPQVHNYQPTFIVCMIIMQVRSKSRPDLPPSLPFAHLLCVHAQSADLRAHAAGAQPDARAEDRRLLCAQGHERRHRLGARLLRTWAGHRAVRG